MSESFKALIGNGRHPDGYAPHAVYRWFEFLEFYVAERTPFLNPLIRTFGPAEFGGSFGMDYVLFEEDRFVDYASYEEALAAYEQEPPVRVLFETGGVVGEEGWPVPNYEASYDSWPPNDAQTRDWYLDEQGQLSDTTALSEGFDQWRHDAEAEGVTFFGPAGYQLLEPLWDINWTYFADGDYASYLTEPFEEAAMISGPGYADLGFAVCRRCGGSGRVDRSSARRVGTADSIWLASIRTPRSVRWRQSATCAEL